MAEYIDREKTQAYLYNNMMWYDEEGYIAEDSEKDKALWNLVKGVPTADVIEREKVEQAREEIEELATEQIQVYDEENPYISGVVEYVSLIEVRELLDNLIAESEGKCK